MYRKMSKCGAWAVDEPQLKTSDKISANFLIVHMFNITFHGKWFLSLRLLKKEVGQGQSPLPIYV